MLWYIEYHMFNGTVSPVCDTYYGGLLVYDTYEEAKNAVKRFPNDSDRYEIRRIIDYPNYHFKK